MAKGASDDGPGGEGNPKTRCERLQSPVRRSKIEGPFKKRRIFVDFGVRLRV